MPEDTTTTGQPADTAGLVAESAVDASVTATESESPGLIPTDPTAVATRPASKVPKKAREAQRRLFAGESITDIAQAMSVSRQTVYRWLSKVNEEAREQLEAQSGINLIVQELDRLTDLERKAREVASKSNSERMQVAGINAALRAVQQRIDLLIRTGVMPSQPDRVYQEIVTLKPSDLRRSGSADGPKSKPEIIAELIDKMARASSI